MSKIVVMMAAVGASLVMASTVLAGVGRVANTAHNLSSSSLSAFFKSSSENQICIFCHTPHNASPSVPLWNKVMPTQSFNMYTSSPTLSLAAKAVTAPGPESLLCLSCHDGRTAINVVHNTSNPTATTVGNEHIIALDFGSDPNTPVYGSSGGVSLGTFTWDSSYGANLGKTSTDVYSGTNLMDDHPISFSYDAAQTSKPQQLNDRTTVVAAKSGNAIRFFGPEHRLECSSCHDPHVDYGYIKGVPTNTGGNTELRPFLVMSNTGSALCLACHNK